VTDEAISVTTTVGAFESPRFLKTIRRRIMGRWRILVVVVAPVVVAVLIAISIVAVMEMPPDYRLAAMAVFLVPSLGSGAAIVRFVTRRMRREWLARGVPAEISNTFSVLPEGLQVESQVATTLIRWPFINELMLVDGHWLLISVVFALVIPRTCFPSDAEEHAFLEAFVGHLEPAARARSIKAERAISQLIQRT
jgi:hypothetical protein